MEPIKVFISYSHKDEDIKKQLEKHLNILRRNGQIELWHDRKIGAGSDFGNTIDGNLKTSQIILLLVSSDFIDSDYCYEIEMKEALKLHSENTSVVIPIILRDCSWHKAPFGKLTALPTDGKAIMGKEWFNVDEAFTDVEQGIENVIENLKKEISIKDISTIAIEKADPQTIQEAIEVFNIEAQRLNFNSSIEEFKKIEKLKRELYLQLFENIDQKIENTPKLREKQPDELFDTICASEMLDQLTIQKISKIREDKKLYKWHERVVIVSAISLSLLTHRRFDQKKANLLIDFLTDFEDNVWKNALTGLILGLIYHKNKWDRFADLKKRLEILKNIDEVQDGLNTIDYILRANTFRDGLFKPDLYSEDFFSSPSNCFLPFYEGNQVLETFIENASSEFDTEAFIDSVVKLPFLNCMKYWLCLTTYDRSDQRKKITKEEYKKMTFLVNHLRLSKVFEPYQNIISDFYNFVKFYPKEKFDNIFLDNLSITRTKLKDIVLSKKTQLRLIGASNMDKENYLEAISNFIDLLTISPNDTNAHVNIARCYSSLPKPNFKECLTHLLLAENLIQNKTDILIMIGQCYKNLKSYEKGIEYFKKAQSIDKNIEAIYLGLCNCYDGLKDSKSSLEVLKTGEGILPKSFKIIIFIGITYAEIKNHDMAIVYFKKALEISPDGKIDEPCIHLASVYMEIGEVNLALDWSLKAFNFAPKRVENLIMLGRVYFIGKIDIKLARRYLERSLRIEKKDIAFGNLGHIDLCENNHHDALHNYLQCARLMADKNTFIEKFDSDIEYILQYGISKENYLAVREEVLQKWPVT